jgi:hypothetical protein
VLLANKLFDASATLNPLAVAPIVGWSPIAADVMSAIQVLRAQALAARNLKSGSQLTVVHQSMIEFGPDGAAGWIMEEEGGQWSLDTASQSCERAMPRSLSTEV